jgi:hypothetical protein
MPFHGYYTLQVCWLIFIPTWPAIAAGRCSSGQSRSAPVPRLSTVYSNAGSKAFRTSSFPPTACLA